MITIIKNYKKLFVSFLKNDFAGEVKNFDGDKESDNILAKKIAENGINNKEFRNLNKLIIEANTEKANEDKANIEKETRDILSSAVSEMLEKGFSIEGSTSTEIEEAYNGFIKIAEGFFPPWENIENRIMEYFAKKVDFKENGVRIKFKGIEINKDGVNLLIYKESGKYDKSGESIFLLDEKLKIKEGILGSIIAPDAPKGPEDYDNMFFNPEHEGLDKDYETLKIEEIRIKDGVNLILEKESNSFKFTEHEVAKGDTLYSITIKYYGNASTKNMKLIIKKNGIKHELYDDGRIKSVLIIKGSTLKIPQIKN